MSYHQFAAAYFHAGRAWAIACAIEFGVPLFTTLCYVRKICATERAMKG
jgi:hypothetical protein